MPFFRRASVVARVAIAFLGGWIAAAASPYEPLIIVSLDGFRWDYFDLYAAETPTLRKLRAAGVSAKALVPVFPSNTFPNHYSIVTGLRPTRHGIINNNMYDPELGLFFVFSNKMTVRNPQWWGGEPIWVTAQKQGKVAACSFWVGSEALIQGQMPKLVRHYDPKLSIATRLEEYEGWLRLPAGQRPDVVTIYLEDANAVGHRQGPKSTAMAAAAAQLDASVSEILERARHAGAAPNLVVLSDHGMADLDPELFIDVESIVELNTVQVDFFGPVLGLRPLEPLSVNGLLEKLQNLPKGAVAHRAEDLQAHLHMSGNARVPPVIVLPPPGGWIATKARGKEQFATTRGEHGYDPSLKDMQGVLIAHGPAFRTDGSVVPAVENVHLYNLFCRVLNLAAAPNDGDERLIQGMLPH